MYNIEQNTQESFKKLFFAHDSLSRFGVTVRVWTLCLFF